MLNSLSMEDRRHARLNRVAWNWFNDMTEEEKGEFLEATMPSGFKQMLTAFEQMPASGLACLAETVMRFQCRAESPVNLECAFEPSSQLRNERWRVLPHHRQPQALVDRHSDALHAGDGNFFRGKRCR